MIIFNTTFHIDNEVHDNALQYLKNVYIPQAMQSGELSLPRLRKIIGAPEDEGHSYSVQFSVRDTGILQHWAGQVGLALNAGLLAAFSDKVTGFSTLLQEIDL